MKQYKVGILIFNKVQVPDFTGPFEVFLIMQYPNNSFKAFYVSTVSQSGNKITARGGLKIVTDYSFDNAFVFDILLIPCGYGAEQIEIHKCRTNTVDKNTSRKNGNYCIRFTGAFLLAQSESFWIIKNPLPIS